MEHTLRLVCLVILCIYCLGYSIPSSDNEKIQDYKLTSHIINEGIDMVLDNKIDEGHQLFKKALMLAEQKNYQELIPIIVISQSRLFALEDRHQEGLDVLLSIEPYFIENHDRPYAGDYFEYLGHTYLKLGNLDLALSSLKICEGIRLREEPSKNWRTYKGMAEIFERQGNTELAEENTTKARRLSKMQNSKKMLDDIKTDLTFNEKEGTIAILSLENRSTKTALRHAQSRNLYFGLGLAFLALFSGFLFILLRQRNKLNREVNLRNELISKNLEEKEYLIKEIHHRVKNNLQVISSLLSLQSRSVNDQSAVDALHESQSRVASMSLIHQNLYKENNNSMIDLKTYLTNLCHKLFTTYNIDQDRIKLKLQIEEMNIDVGSLVPLGLIINELITNSLKYAFIEKTNGMIGISCKQESSKLVLKVWDDGIGQTPIGNSEGFGYRLIKTFAARLDAKLSKTTENGTCIELVINQVKKAI